MPLLFSYGTLQKEEVQRATFGRPLQGRVDVLVGFERSLVKIEDPQVAAASGATHHANAVYNGSDDSRVSGMVFEVTSTELVAADQYEQPSAYERVLVVLASGRQAWVYVHSQSAESVPKPSMALTVKQRGVLKGVIVGAAITFVVIVGTILVGPIALSPDASAGERLAFAIWADAFIALWLGISIGLLARHRFFTPEDIDGGGLSRGSETANVLQSTLQNTLEQSVLAVLVHLAWSILMPVSWISAIPAAVFLFLCGRVLFVRGYRGGAPSRALGFALTYYPSVLMLILVVVAAVGKVFRWS